MKIHASVLFGEGQGCRVEEVELLPPQRGEVLVRMAAAGICHSDLHVIDGVIKKPFPIILGHEGSGIVQEPLIQITEVRTTVSVPDGGTLLLGGQTLAGEIEREAGVPVLSKIPFLKRLFTNRGMAKDDQVLLILVKPTIIIQREQEQRQFPLLTTRTNG